MALTTLSNYKIPRATIDLPNGDAFAVRGLNVDDVSFLVQVHKGDVDAVVAMVKGNMAEAKTPDDIAAAVSTNGDTMLMTALQHFPILMANVIAAACDEPEAWENAAALPVPVQLDAVVNIVRLTFNDVDGFKKFVGNVAAVLQSVKQRPQTKSTGITA